MLICSEQGNTRMSWKGPCRTCVSCGESCIPEDKKASCDACQRWMAACDLSGWKPHVVKAKQKGTSVIDLDEDMEIQQPGTMMPSLLQELVKEVQENIMEQWKQTRLLAQLVHVQELDCAEWIGAEDLETVG